MTKHVQIILECRKLIRKVSEQIRKAADYINSKLKNPQYPLVELDASDEDVLLMILLL